MLKKTKLRYNEYYDMQRVYDSLYSASKNGNNFYKLLEIIGSEENIRLAYRNLKSNKGSNTKGTDGKTIDDIKELTDETVINTVREMLADYKPKSVRRVYIPKPGSDKKRPLGIRVYGTDWFSSAYCRSLNQSVNLSFTTIHMVLDQTETHITQLVEQLV